MASTPKNVTVTVIVSGVGKSVTVNANQFVRELVREALRLTGNQGQDPGAWNLRRDGVDIDQEVKIADVPILDGDELDLAPVRGEGG